MLSKKQETRKSLNTMKRSDTMKRSGDESRSNPSMGAPLQEAIVVIKDTNETLKQLVQKTKDESKITNNSNITVLKDFLSLNPPSFEKAWADPSKGETWMRKLEKIFEIMGCSDNQKVMLATYMLQGKADHWWSMIKRTRFSGPDNNSCTWAKFRELFYERFISQLVRDEKIPEFETITQGDLSVSQYEDKFMDLYRFVADYCPDEFYCAKKFEDGLNSEIKSEVASSRTRTYTDIVNRALDAETRIGRDYA